MFVSYNNEAVAMLVSQTNPVGVQLLSYAKAFLLSQWICIITTDYVIGLSRDIYRPPYQLLSQNNKSTAMLMFQASPVREIFFLCLTPSFIPIICTI